MTVGLGFLLITAFRRIDGMDLMRAKSATDNPNERTWKQVCVIARIYHIHHICRDSLFEHVFAVFQYLLRGFYLLFGGVDVSC